MQRLSWKSFLLRWLASLLAATVACFVAFLVCQWLMPPVLAWASTHAAFFGGPDLVQRLNDFGPAGVAGMVFVGVVAIGRSWADAGRPRQELPTPAPPQVVFGAIPRQAWCFQARPVQQDGLRQALAAGHGKAAALVALPGARGVGKSQLAAMYARECADAGYALVAWINAESGPVTGLAQLAGQLGIGDSKQSPEQLAGNVLSVLQRRDGSRRLLVFDNAEEPTEMATYLPTVGNIEVIITSNRQEFSTMAGITSIPVETYTPEQGRGFLAEATGLLEDADALGSELGWLPLGLAQAAAYVQHNKLDYRQYLDALRTQNLDETLTQLAGADHPGILKVTALSLAGLARDDPSGLSSRLLAMLSVLSTDGVSRSVLTGEVVRAALHTDETGMARTLRMLADTSLVSLSSGSVITVHRLTARVIRHVAGDCAAQAILTATGVVETLSERMPREQVAYRRSELDELVAHILAIGECAGDPQPRLLKLADWAGEALLEAGDLTRAISLFQIAVTGQEQVLGLDDPLTLVARNDLASAYWMAGRSGEGIALFQRTLADRIRVLGSNHSDTLLSRSNLAYAYQSSGRLDEAIALGEETIANQVRELGTDHRDTFLSRNNLAFAFQVAGRLDEAIALFETNLADRTRVLGDKHQDTLYSRSNLAGAYQLVGHVAEAIVLFESTLADRTEVLGANHPQTLDSGGYLAGAFAAAGRRDEAIGLYERTLAECLRVLSPDHPVTAKIRERLQQV